VTPARSQDSVAGTRGFARDEQGFAVPVVLVLLLGAMAIVTAIVIAAIQAQSGATRDVQSKAALQAAEGGVSQALLRYNTYNSTANPLTGAFPCITDSGRAATSSGWCPAVSATTTGGSATYSVRPVWTNGTGSSLEIVSQGNSSGITRRVDVLASSASNQQEFINASVLAQTGINMAANAEIHAGSQTNGDIAESSNAKVCGLASVGMGRAMTLAGNAGYWADTACTQPLSASSVGHAILDLPPATDGDAAVNNDDARITNAVNGSGSPADLISGNRADVSWNAATRDLIIDHNTNITLTGTKYSFCHLQLKQNSAIYVTVGQSVSIFIDSPEACNQPSGTTQVELDSNTRITGVGGSPATVGLIMVGSPTLTTNMLMSSNTQVASTCVQNFVIYAPRTEITMNSNSQYCGAVAGHSLTMSSNSQIYTNSASQSYSLPATPPHFTPLHFVECNASTVSPSPPNSGC
jgi:hypothetical protein